MDNFPISGTIVLADGDGNPIITNGQYSQVKVSEEIKNNLEKYHKVDINNHIDEILKFENCASTKTDVSSGGLITNGVASGWFKAVPTNPYRIDFVQDDENAKLPYYATNQAACGDLYSVEDLEILPGKVAIVSTGLKVAYVPSGYKLEIYDRSGFGAKGIFVANGVGQIDSDYRGVLKVLLYNSNDVPFKISVGDRIAQVAVEEVIKMPFSFVESIQETERGEGGFGSTGLK